MTNVFLNRESANIILSRRDIHFDDVLFQLRFIFNETLKKQLSLGHDEFDFYVPQNLKDIVKPCMQQSSESKFLFSKEKIVEKLLQILESQGFEVRVMENQQTHEKYVHVIIKREECDHWSITTALGLNKVDKVDEDMMNKKNTEEFIRSCLEVEAEARKKVAIRKTTKSAPSKHKSKKHKKHVSSAPNSPAAPKADNLSSVLKQNAGTPTKTEDDTKSVSSFSSETSNNVWMSADARKICSKNVVPSPLSVPSTPDMSFI